MVHHLQDIAALSRADGSLDPDLSEGSSLRQAGQVHSETRGTGIGRCLRLECELMPVSTEP